MPNNAKKPARVMRISPAAKPRTRGEFFKTVAEATELSRKQVASVFETTAKVIAADCGKTGPGIVNLGGLMKIKVVRKPATKAREGINPFTKQTVIFKAKPARNVLKIRPLKSLKAMV